MLVVVNAVSLSGGGGDRHMRCPTALCRCCPPRIVERGHYTEKDAAKLVRTIVKVVAHCHSMSVIHRDLKPENFLLTDNTANAVIKATDFGLSVFFKEGQVRLAPTTQSIQAETAAGILRGMIDSCGDSSFLTWRHRVTSCDLHHPPVCALLAAIRRSPCCSLLQGGLKVARLAPCFI